MDNIESTKVLNWIYLNLVMYNGNFLQVPSDGIQTLTPLQHMTSISIASVVDDY